MRPSDPPSPVSEEDSWLHAGPPGDLYLDQDFQQLSAVLKLPSPEAGLREAGARARLVGGALEAWVDGSAGAFWLTGDLCSTSGATPPSPCPGLAPCTQTSWSALSPDPKAHLGPVKSDGRIR